MNKKILTAAIGAALVAGPLAAQADYKISGSVSGSLVSQDGVILFQDNGRSRLQFDISDDSGWYGRIARDMRLGRNAGLSTITSNLPMIRDQYVGLKTSFGSFQFGRMAGAVKNNEADPYITTFLELRNNAVLGGGTGLGSSGFRNNLIQYANKFGDATVKLQYNPVDVTVDPSNGELAASIIGKIAGARVYAGYSNLGNSGSTFYKLGGSMKFGNINAKLHYEDFASFTNWNIGGEMGLGNGAAVDVTYADKGRDGTNAYYRLAYMKKASKKSRWWVGYVQNGNKVAANGASYGAGARVDL